MLEGIMSQIPKVQQGSGTPISADSHLAHDVAEWERKRDERVALLCGDPKSDKRSFDPNVLRTCTTKP